MPILETKNLTKAFDALIAVSDVTLEVEPGKIHAIIGPNGAGKTTFFNLLAGVFPPTSGKIIYNGKDISALKLHQRARIGIGRSYQVTSIFPELSVYENVRIAVQSRTSYNFSLFKVADRLKEIQDQTDAILLEIGLINLKGQIASTIPYGSQRALDVAIALSTNPQLLLLDEPTSGMSPDDTLKMIDLVKRISEKYTIVLIEHHMNVVMSISDTITVFNQGRIIASGSPREIQQNNEVQKAYLGGGRF
ncbi:MAG: ABC transporter ATP-binding protein [Deltaproteobacteria bacterium]|nr:ABC transporter ATP-binding protein [Deltaproteobacteria bacterium]MBW1962607.1 ABC transporter ATP-binding protein [Deltaproteobacteria bacterium]MBW2154232.1 ABC transporter ATP-binding protein [Deltaproteobacteria bacterium]